VAETARPENQMTDIETRLRRLEQNLLMQMETAQAQLPDDVETTSEALERHARIIALLIRGFEVLRKSHPKDSGPSPEQALASRQALIAEIEQKLGRLAQTETAPSSAQPPQR